MQKIKHIPLSLFVITCFFVPLTFGQQRVQMDKKVQTKQVLVNGVNLNYIEKGDGDPVILVHGTLGDYRTWEEQVDPFSNYFRVISYSRRYHFPNPWPENPSNFSATVHVKDLVSFIHNLEIQQAHLVGHSFGAFIALLVARDNPELVRTLTLGEPPMPMLLPPSESNVPNIQIRKAFEEGETEKAVQLFINGVLGDHSFQKLPLQVRSIMMDNARELEGAITEEHLFAPFSCEDASKMDIPTLLIEGELSPEAFGHAIDNLEKCLPNNERVIIPDASHGLEYENPQDFNRKVLQFLKKY